MKGKKHSDEQIIRPSRSQGIRGGRFGLRASAVSSNRL